MSDKNIRAVPAGSDTAGNQKTPLPLANQEAKALKSFAVPLLLTAHMRRHLSRLRQALHGNGCVRLCLNVISAGYSGMISSLSGAYCLAPTGNSLKAERSGLLVPFIVFGKCDFATEICKCQV